MKLSPFFTFYGGKFRAAPRYPAPVHDTVIEPFAGAAGYSVRHAARRVILVERDPAVAATWRYLISVSRADVLALPDLAPGQSVDDLSVSDEARLLIGWYCGRGLAIPRKTQSVWISNYWISAWEEEFDPADFASELNNGTNKFLDLPREPG